MPSGKPRWKLSFHRSSSPSTATETATKTEETPMEFVCPISASVMADPVIIPSGQTFERACIQACKDLSFSPPSLSIDIDSSSSFFIPNVALKTAILTWCDRLGLPHPRPISQDDALRLVRRLIISSPTAADPAPSTTTTTTTSSAESSAKSGRSFGGPATPPRSMPSNNSSSFSPTSSSYSSYHSSSSEIVIASDETLALNSLKTPKLPTSNFPTSPTVAADPLEEEILVKLRNPQISEQESALISLRQATRESSQRRLLLCTPKLLAALRPMLLSRYPAVQINATASIVNLSLESPNKVRIVRSMAVPPLVDVLKFGHFEAQEHAAGALFSLALEDDNRAAVGVLGAIPPLLHLFSRVSAARRARWEAGMALYNLSLGANNRSILARTAGTVQALLGVAADVAVQPPLGRVALMVICNMAGCGEGRTAMMDAGAVVGVVNLMKGGVIGPAEEEYCLAALYGMSRGRRSLRFMGLARAAGAEEVLMRMAAEGEEGVGEARREMARRTMRAVRGGEEEEEVAAADYECSVVSDGLISFRRRFKDFGNGSGPNSAEF